LSSWVPIGSRLRTRSPGGAHLSAAGDCVRGLLATLTQVVAAAPQRSRL